MGVNVIRTSSMCLTTVNNLIINHVLSTLDLAFNVDAMMNSVIENYYNFNAFRCLKDQIPRENLLMNQAAT